MDILLQKSIKNIEAAILLHEKDMFCSSVHCSYYSWIQLMNHIILDVLNELDERKLVTEINANGKGSHVFLIKYFQNKLELLTKNGKKFNDDAFEFKGIRENSDYKSLVIEIEDSEEALNYSKKLNGMLKKAYKI